jgi:hypothetical protein
LGCEPWAAPVTPDATLDHFLAVERARGTSSRLAALGAAADKALRKLRRCDATTHAWRWAVSRYLWMPMYGAWVYRVTGQDDKGAPTGLVSKETIGPLTRERLEELGDFLRDIAERLPAMKRLFVRKGPGRADTALEDLVTGGLTLGMGFKEMAEALIARGVEAGCADEAGRDPVRALAERMRERMPQRRVHHARKHARKRLRGK